MHELLQSYLPHVYRYALYLVRDHHLAEDITQETMLRAWRHRKRVKDQQAVRVWLLKIAANLCRDAMRRKGHVVSQAGPISLADQVSGMPVESDLVYQETVDKVMLAMNRLSSRSRDVFYLSTFEQLSHLQIAEVLAMSRDSVKTTLSQAKRSMRQWLITEVENDNQPHPKTGATNHV